MNDIFFMTTSDVRVFMPFHIITFCLYHRVARMESLLHIIPFGMNSTSIWCIRDRGQKKSITIIYMSDLQLICALYKLSYVWFVTTDKLKYMQSLYTYFGIGSCYNVQLFYWVHSRVFPSIIYTVLVIYNKSQQRVISSLKSYIW